MTDHPKAAFEKGLHKAVADALNRICAEHGARITGIQATWHQQRPDDPRAFVVRALETAQYSDDYLGGLWVLKTTQVFQVCE